MTDLTLKAIEALNLRRTYADLSIETAEQLARAQIPKGMFPADDDRPVAYVPRCKLLVPLFDGDQGARPVPRLRNRTPGVALTDQHGRAVNTLRPGLSLNITGTVFNLGNADAPATTVEAFVGYGRRVTADVLRRLPGDVLRVEDIFSISGRGTFVTGPLVSGSFAVGNAVTLASGKQSVVTEVTRRGRQIGLQLRGIIPPDVLRGETVTGRPAREETATVQQQQDDAAAVQALKFIDVRYVDVPCERAARVTIPWSVPASTPGSGEILSATIYLRCYSYAPSDFPGDLNSLDPQTARHLGRTRVKAIF